ncbi:MAG: thioredoxin domain-containing protein [Patescibacteria group bacterium]
MPNKKTISAVVIIVISLGLLAAFWQKEGSAQGGSVTSLNSSDWTRGAPNPKITLIEYGDFQCPACRSYEGVVQQLSKDFKDTLSFGYRHFPLVQIHQNALLSSKASEAAGLQGGFWEMHDILYEKQSEWSTASNGKEIFIGYAKSLGLDIARFEKDLESAELTKKIEANYRDGLRLDVSSTPTFFLNGKKIKSPGSLEDFKKLIEKELSGSGAL